VSVRQSNVTGMTTPGSGIARWKDLCIDAVDPDLLGPFWAAALGLTDQRHDDGDHALVGPCAEHRVWINRVAEPVTVKQRVHLDLHAASVAEVEGRGGVAVSEPGEHNWTVCRDPEGGEFCVFVREDPPELRLYEIVVDTVDPGRIAQWWADVFGAIRVDDPKGYSWVEKIPGAPFESMDFVPVPELKSVKNRIHWDVVGSVAALQAAGARVVRPQEDDIAWTVRGDPEGNEFCAFESR
jgi:hypothetical protein